MLSGGGLSPQAASGGGEMLSIAEKLQRLAEVHAEREALEGQKQKLVEEVIPADVRSRLDDIEAEFAQKVQAAAATIETLEAEIKAETLAHGESVRAAGYQAVWTKGRQTWDSKGLSTYGEAHPEILQFRKEGDPSVSIRRAGGKEGN
jgi:hypothetical protein